MVCYDGKHLSVTFLISVLTIEWRHNFQTIRNLKGGMIWNYDDFEIFPPELQ